MKKNKVDYIKENLDVRKILEHYDFKKLKEYQTEFRACCRIHDGSNETGFVWNKENNLWFCYTGDCGGGDVFDLVMKLEQCDFIVAVNTISSILGLNTDGMEISDSSTNLIKEQNKWLESQRKLHKKINFKEYKLPLAECQSEIPPQFDIRQRLNKVKNFVYPNKKTNSVYKFYKVYPTPNGELYNKLAFPIYENNICVGVALRDVTGIFKPKWMFQPKGLKVSNILYNFDVAKKEIEENDLDEIILVEGILDVMAFENIGIKNVVAIFGSSISEEQYKKILKLGVNVTLCFDNDDAGNKCYRKTKEKFKYSCSIKKIELPEGCDPMDVNPEDLHSAYMAT